MNKKILLGVTAVAGATVLTAVHGYFDVMARENNFKSIIGRIAARNSVDDNFASYNQAKQEWIKEQYTEHISITSERGQRLQGYLTYPEKESKVFVFCAHGYHADHAGDPANFLRYYVEKGCNFLSVDHVASGDSEGVFVGFDYYESQDSLKWLDYLIDRFGEDIKIIIHGVSMGGATVCKMVENVPKQVKLAVADCPYTNALEEFHHVVGSVGIKNPDPLVKIFNGMNRVIAGYNLNDTDVRHSVENSRVPMLFVHGKADDFVPPEMGIELYELCKNEKDLLLVEGAPHAQSIVVGEEEYHHKLDEFIEKYL